MLTVYLKLLNNIDYKISGTWEFLENTLKYHHNNRKDLRKLYNKTLTTLR